MHDARTQNILMHDARKLKKAVHVCTDLGMPTSSKTTKNKDNNINNSNNNNNNNYTRAHTRTHTHKNTKTHKHGTRLFTLSYTFT